MDRSCLVNSGNASNPGLGNNRNTVKAPNICSRRRPRRRQDPRRQTMASTRPSAFSKPGRDMSDLGIRSSSPVDADRCPRVQASGYHFNFFNFLNYFNSRCCLRLARLHPHCHSVEIVEIVEKVEVIELCDQGRSGP